MDKPISLTYDCFRNRWDRRRLLLCQSSGDARAECPMHQTQKLHIQDGKALATL